MAYARKNPVNPQRPVPDSLRFERRRADRHAITGKVTTLQLHPTPGAPALSKIASMELVNISDSGVCVLTAEPVEVDAALTIFFPPHGLDRGFEATGRVVRTLQREGQMRELGIRFDFKPAA